MMSLFVPEIAVLEKVLRSVVVYLFMLLAFRFTASARSVSSRPSTSSCCWSSRTWSRTRSSDPTTRSGRAPRAAVILGLNYLVVELTFRSKPLRRLLEATPTLLIHNGHILYQNLRKERITLDDLHAALRRSGIVDPEQVRAAVLEENGGISVIPRQAGGPA